MLIGSIVTDILDTIQSGIFWLLLKLDAIVYTFIDWIYQIILMLADGDLLSNSNLVDELVNRLYLIIGVIILFLVAYSLLRSMVNPDEALKGKESPVKIVQNVIISVVLIAVIPYVFNFAMGFQTSLLQQNTIGRLILGEGSGENASSSTIDDGGFNIAISVFQAFFQPNTSAGYCTGNASIDQNYPDCEDLVAEIGAYNNFEEWWANDVIASKNLFAISEANTLVAQNKISYTFIISTLAGAFVVFVLASYCIDIAIRLVKLAVFQLIAPLPILARIVPNEQTKKIFSNWLKATISTYVEVFIRLGILFFAVFIIDLVVANFNTIFDTMGNNLGNVNPVLVLIAQALVILGIILFVKQLPGIIKDITGLDGGKYGKSLIRGIGMLGATFGGGATAAIRSVVNDKDKPMSQKLGRGLLAGVSGGARGFRQGAKTDKLGDIPKAAGTASSNALSARARREAAGGWGNYLSQWVDNKKNDAIGWASGSFEAQQKMLEQVNEFVKDAKAVKSTSEGFIRDKKYLFKYGANEEFGEKEIEVDSGRKDENGKAIMEKKIVPRARITQDTTLSELDAMIQTLKSSGDVEDAKVAAALESKMNQKIKTIGKQLAAVSVDRSKAAEFDAQFSSAASKGIVSEAMVALDQTKSAYEIVQKKFAANQALEGVQNFKNDEVDGGNLTTGNVSKLADYLESQSSKIQENIKTEQERRKAANPKGKDK